MSGLKTIARNTFITNVIKTVQKQGFKQVVLKNGKGQITMREFCDVMHQHGFVYEINNENPLAVKIAKKLQKAA